MITKFLFPADATITIVAGRSIGVGCVTYRTSDEASRELVSNFVLGLQR